MESAERLAVEVAYSPAAGQIDLLALEVPRGATLLDALRASGVLHRHALAEGDLRAGVWGRERPLDMPLRDGDRVEIYRALAADPKEARRQRHRRHDDGGMSSRRRHARTADERRDRSRSARRNPRR